MRLIIEGIEEYLSEEAQGVLQKEGSDGSKRLHRMGSSLNLAINDPEQALEALRKSVGHLVSVEKQSQ